MRAEKIVASAIPKSQQVDANLFFGAEKDQWLNTVTAGQILKGRILKVYGDHKYGVSFGGKERIVDSSIPLTVGNVITGQVQSINEKNVSMRLVQTIPHEKNTTSHQVFHQSPLDAQAVNLGISLSALDQKTIASAASESKAPAVIISVGLYLVKLGLPVTIDLIRLLSSRIMSARDLNDADSEKMIPMLDFDPILVDSQTLLPPDVLERLVQDFQGMDMDALDADIEPSDLSLLDNLAAAVKPIESDEQQLLGGEPDSSDADVARVLASILNANTGAKLQHALKTLSVIIDGKLVEFDVAFFNQLPGNETMENTIESKSIRFSLETSLGQLGLMAKIVNNRVRISFNAMNDMLLSDLQAHESHLVNQLVDAGWSVDAINFAIDADEHWPGLHVINHALQQGSVNLMA
ncbi:hypothetical protein Meth11DRAFT_1126 [Methylophilaceae bacterium 11]|nr:hypothetical protein Meth11DRAFT_1126 [Methylophilaceae bacterium 11]